MPQSGFLVEDARNTRDRLVKYGQGERGYVSYSLPESMVIEGGRDDKIVNIVVDNQGHVFIKQESLEEKGLYNSGTNDKYVPTYVLTKKILSALENMCSEK